MVSRDSTGVGFLVVQVTAPIVEVYRKSGRPQWFRDFIAKLETNAALKYHGEPGRGADRALLIALRTDGSERQTLAAWLLRARGAAELAVTPAENLHVTLAFLGELDPDRVEVARQAVRSAGLAAAPGWWVHWAAPGVFPGPRGRACSGLELTIGRGG